jgi:hypothetical protein
MKNNTIGIFVGLCLACHVSNAYEVPTHENMSESALVRSDIATGDLLAQLGLDPYSSNKKFLNPKTLRDQLTIKELLRQGANFEDNAPRFLNHFYDPINNTGLGVMNTSPGWALEDTADDGEQAYSYKDAMQYFYDALTKNSEAERNSSWGKTFQTLGQVIHHVQDMAQPEHVRNDQHLLGVDTSWYEDYTNSDQAKLHVTTLLNSNSYLIPVFPTAREFWTTRATEVAELLRKGIADFTNRNFVSNNTNFYYDGAGLLLTTDYHYPQPEAIAPPLNIADADMLGTAAGQALCTKLKQTPSVTFAPGNCFIDFVSTSVTDSYTNTTTINERASSYSVFNKKLEDYGKTVAIHHDDSVYKARGIFTLNAINYDYAHNYLIPRAVSYSAGLINHSIVAI